MKKKHHTVYNNIFKLKNKIKMNKILIYYDVKCVFFHYIDVKCVLIYQYPDIFFSTVCSNMKKTSKMCHFKVGKLF